jgi:hypothetical protein
MKITLDIDADVLQAARELATMEHVTAGSMISALARMGLGERTDDAVADRPLGKVVSLEEARRIVQDG